ncbi:MAG: hypothetical protein N3B16_02450 [Candidatus Aminicenantes bacterium]|nr:hypothetical protein [Candidatus Aminicenantes bacterium]
MALKARGMVLKEWKLDDVRRWGSLPAIKVLTLEKKSALFAPKRKKIKPGESQSSANFELEALELKDMPTIYTLRFNSRLKIYVRPSQKTFLGYLASMGFFFRWYGWFPVQNLFLKMFKRPIMLIEIKTASLDEARAIYWALIEGIRGIIYSLPGKQ